MFPRAVGERSCAQNTTAHEPSPTAGGSIKFPWTKHTPSRCYSSLSDLKDAYPVSAESYTSYLKRIQYPPKPMLQTVSNIH